MVCPCFPPHYEPAKSADFMILRRWQQLVWCAFYIAHGNIHLPVWGQIPAACSWYERDYFQIFVLIRRIGLISAGPKSFSFLFPRLPFFFFFLCSHFLMELTSKQKIFFCLCTHAFWAHKFNNKQPQQHALSLASERAFESTGLKVLRD
jgi:hypothetical protein